MHIFYHCHVKIKLKFILVSASNFLNFLWFCSGFEILLLYADDTNIPQPFIDYMIAWDYFSPCIYNFFLHIFGKCLALILQQQPFYGHYKGQPVLAGTPVKNWRILLEQSFTASLSLLMATSTFWIREKTLYRVLFNVYVILILFWYFVMLNFVLRFS